MAVIQQRKTQETQPAIYACDKCGKQITESYEQDGYTVSLSDKLVQVRDKQDNQVFLFCTLACFAAMFERSTSYGFELSIGGVQR